MPRLIRDILIIVGLVAATFTVYWQVRQHEFVTYDDPLYVTDNQAVQDGLTWPSVKWAFTTGHASNWHPLTWLSLMLDCQIHKWLWAVHGTPTDDAAANPVSGPSPRLMHFMSVAIHALNVVLLFLLLRRMTNLAWPSAFVAGLFALHPLHVESVAWVAERKDVLSTLFGLLALLMYVSYAKRPGIWRYALMLAWYALSLMAKPTLVTLPFVMLLLDFWPLRRIGVTKLPADGVGGMRAPVLEGPGWRWPIACRLVLEKLPLFACAIASSIVTYIVQLRGGSIETPEVLPFDSRIENALVSYGRYLGKTFWPVDLAVLYPHPGHWPPWTVLASAGLLAAIALIFLALARRAPYLIVGWLWFLGTLVPVIGVVQVGIQSIADRYMYVPLIGIGIVVAWGALAIFANARVLLGICGLVILAALGALTQLQVNVWSNSEKLYTHALAVTTNNWVVHSNLGTVLMGKGRVAEASSHFFEAARIRPECVDCQFMAADTLVRLGHVEKAIIHFEKTLAIDPDMVAALNNLAWFRATLPDERMRNGKQAVALAERACRLDNFNDAGHLDTLAVACAEAGLFDDAERYARRARDLAIQNKQTEVVQEVNQHLQLIMQRNPIRAEPPRPTSGP